MNHKIARLLVATVLATATLPLALAKAKSCIDSSCVQTPVDCPLWPHNSTCADAYLMTSGGDLHLYLIAYGQSDRFRLYHFSDTSVSISSIAALGHFSATDVTINQFGPAPTSTAYGFLNPSLIIGSGGARFTMYPYVPPATAGPATVVASSGGRPTVVDVAPTRISSEAKLAVDVISPVDTPQAQAGEYGWVDPSGTYYGASAGVQNPGIPLISTCLGAGVNTSNSIPVFHSYC